MNESHPAVDAAETLARCLSQALPLIGRQCRGVGMALLFDATLRLSYFGMPPLLVPTSAAAGACLAVAVAVNLAIGWWRNSVWLTAVALVTWYAFYHIVPQAWVALSWVGIALFYYVINLRTKARKYRWMGHNTLLLTVVYILLLGVGSLHGAQRIISFLVLGTVLMAVSLVFTMIRARQRRSETASPESDHADPSGP